MMRAWLWWAMLAGLAVLTAGAQIDRATERHSQLATIVPEPMRAMAQPRIVEQAFATGDSERALIEAQRLIRRRPLPAEHLTALAQAQFLAGQSRQSALTIQHAARRGWRDPVAQEAMLRFALDTGKTAEAARRYAALFLHQSTSEPKLEELAPQVFGGADGEARATFAAIVSQAERWHDLFARRGVRVLPPDAFADIFAQVAASGATFDCRNLRNVRRAQERRDSTALDPLDDYLQRAC